MKFIYEIPIDEYVASQTLYYRLTTGGRRVRRASFWIATGIFFIFIAWNQEVFNWAPVLLVITGSWWICRASLILFPAHYFRSHYKGSAVAGEKFQADVDAEGFEVVGDLCSWRVRWAAVTEKGENERVFILVAKGTIFMFGKKYLTAEQQRELRALAAF